MPSRLIIALTLSFVLHSGLLFTDALKFSPPSAVPALRASLRLPPELTAPQLQPEPDPLVKNTLEPETDKSDEQPRTPLTPAKPQRQEAKHARQREIEKVQRKISEFVFYPKEAWAQGIEGTVVLFIEFSGEGSVADVRIFRSSGYPILDNAAAKAAWAALRIPGAKTGEYPYVFRLIP